VAPGHAGKTVTVTWRVSEPILRIVGATGEIVAEHRRVPAGAGQTVRSSEHAAMLQDAVMAAFTTKDACRRKPNLPPSDLDRWVAAVGSVAGVVECCSR